MNVLNTTRRKLTREVSRHNDAAWDVGHSTRGRDGDNEFRTAGLIWGAPCNHGAEFRKNRTKRMGFCSPGQQNRRATREDKKKTMLAEYHHCRTIEYWMPLDRTTQLRKTHRAQYSPRFQIKLHPIRYKAHVKHVSGSLKFGAL